MPKRDPDLLIEDMLAAMGKIERYTFGMDQELFRQDEEGRGRRGSGFIARNPEVPWRQIAGLRNRIVHDYFGLDLDLIWEVIQHDLPQLQARLGHLA